MYRNPSLKNLLRSILDTTPTTIDIRDSAECKQLKKEIERQNTTSNV